MDIHDARIPLEMEVREQYRKLKEMKEGSRGNSAVSGMPHTVRRSDGMLTDGMPPEKLKEMILKHNEYVHKVCDVLELRSELYHHDFDADRFRKEYTHPYH